MVTRLTSGCSEVISKVAWAKPGEPAPPPVMVWPASPLEMAALTSWSSEEVPPVSAISSMPGVAMPPGAHSSMASECVPPTRGEKWALAG